MKQVVHLNSSQLCFYHEAPIRPVSSRCLCFSYQSRVRNQITNFFVFISLSVWYIALSILPNVSIQKWPLSFIAVNALNILTPPTKSLQKNHRYQPEIDTTILVGYVKIPIEGWELMAPVRRIPRGGKSQFPDDIDDQEELITHDYSSKTRHQKDDMDKDEDDSSLNNANDFTLTKHRSKSRSNIAMKSSSTRRKGKKKTIDYISKRTKMEEDHDPRSKSKPLKSSSKFTKRSENISNDKKPKKRKKKQIMKTNKMDGNETDNVTNSWKKRNLKQTSSTKSILTNSKNSQSIKETNDEGRSLNQQLISEQQVDHLAEMKSYSPISNRTPQPPPNALFRFLLRRGVIGRFIVMTFVLLSEFINTYVPPLGRHLNGLYTKIFPPLPPHPIGQQRKKKTATIQKKEFLRRADEFALSQLRRLGNIKDAKYRFVSLQFMQRHGLGSFRGVNNTTDTDEMEEKRMESSKNIITGSFLNNIATFGQQSKRNVDLSNDGKFDWIVAALSTPSRASKKALLSNMDFPNIQIPLNRVIEAERNKVTYRYSPKRLENRNLSSDRDGGDGIVGRIRAVSGSTSVFSRSLLGAYPGDAVARSEAASAFGVVDLARKYGWGEWTSDDEDDDNLHDNNDDDDDDHYHDDIPGWTISDVSRKSKSVIRKGQSPDSEFDNSSRDANRVYLDNNDDFYYTEPNYSNQGKHETAIKNGFNDFSAKQSNKRTQSSFGIGTNFEIGFSFRTSGAKPRHTQVLPARSERRNDKFTNVLQQNDSSASGSLSSRNKVQQQLEHRMNTSREERIQNSNRIPLPPISSQTRRKIIEPDTSRMRRIPRDFDTKKINDDEI